MRPFFVVWTGQGFSLLGSQLVQFGLVWWLTAATTSPKVLALASLTTLALAGLFWLERVETWHIYAMMLVRACGAAFHMPAMQAPRDSLTRVGDMNQALAGAR